MKIPTITVLILVLATFSGKIALHSDPAGADVPCGSVFELKTRGDHSLKYAYGVSTNIQPQAVVLMFSGGNGFLNLDDRGCANKLSGNALIRNHGRLQQAGFATVLVDAPSDYQGKDGLGAFRGSIEHAEDISTIISDIRSRVSLPIYAVGHSRGSISAVNAATLTKPPNSPDGIAILSPVTLGRENAHKKWVAQTVFNLPVEQINLPLLVVAHREDKCVRTPPNLAPKIVEKAAGTKGEMIFIDGGPGSKNTGLAACNGRSPHGFVGQDTELVSFLTEFLRGR